MTPPAERARVIEAEPGVTRRRPVKWNEAILGLGMLVVLATLFIPGLLIYTALFGIGALMRLLGMPAQRPTEKN